jgi:hypothetical protein
MNAIQRPPTASFLEAAVAEKQHISQYICAEVAAASPRQIPSSSSQSSVFGIQNRTLLSQQDLF